MSYSHNQRRKIIRKLKQKFGDSWDSNKWYPHFQDHVDKILEEKEKQLGPPVSLDEILEKINVGLDFKF